MYVFVYVCVCMCVCLRYSGVTQDRYRYTGVRCLPQGQFGRLSRCQWPLQLYFWSSQWWTVAVVTVFINSCMHPMWKVCWAGLIMNFVFYKSLIRAAFCAVSLANCFLLTVLTLWKAKDTQVQQLGGQPRHGKPINKTTEATHRGDMAHPWSVSFLNGPCSFSSKLPNDDKAINLHH